MDVHPVTEVEADRLQDREGSGVREHVHGPQHTGVLGDDGRSGSIGYRIQVALDRGPGVVGDFLAGTPDGAPIATLRQSRRRPAAGWASLTEAEMDVVRLVTAGMTNRQIAERLYLSPRTIQTHVSHIMRKLGIARRSEIAAETSRRQR